ncbi:MAG: putative periplasmic or secreted lipoprotein [Candidatus Angelobacter sp.]|nr:putative periplasmic or secreted lipoprotein [Candidatus Angelobacter sp.]
MFNLKQTFSFLGLVAILTLGCSSAPQSAKNNTPNNDVRSDAQIAGDVQTRISSDPNLRGRQISINAENGVVTLGGTVSSKDDVMAALKDAQGADGVKQVVSWLEIGSSDSAESDVKSKPSPRHVSRPAPRQYARVAPAPQPAAPVAPPVNSTPAFDTAKASPPPPPSVPEVVKVSVPAGTELHVRTLDNLSSETSRPDQIFHGTLNSDVTVDDQVVIPAGADVEGRVVEVHSSTHYAGQALLTLQLTKLTYGEKNYTLSTDQWTRKAEGRGANTAEKVGGGAAIGAVLGGIFGGGKGAAIGAASGGGLGAGANTITKGKPVELRPESLVVFRTASAITVAPSSGTHHGPRLTASN